VINWGDDVWEKKWYDMNIVLRAVDILLDMEDGD